MQMRAGMRAAASFGLVLSALVAWCLAGWAGSALASGSAATPLSTAFDNVGISVPGAPAANFDGNGDGYTAAGLAADGLIPGRALLHDGLRISWPQPSPSGTDNVVADGQTIALSGSGNTLGVVGAASYAGAGSAGGSFTVTYSDGSTTTGTLNFADWADNSPATGTDLLATSLGAGSGLSAPVALYYGSIPLDPGKTVVSVTLPSVSATAGRNAPALHIFDLTVGTAAGTVAGAPGSLSYYDLGRKDCVGTAADTESKVWYTVADGTLSDVYSPTIDNTNVKSLDPIVTGSAAGAAFTDLQPRDMTYTVSQLGSTGMACRVVALPKASDQHFAIVTDFVTSPVNDAVVMHVSLVRLPGAPSSMHVYLRFNPLLNGHGGGGDQNVGGESATIVNGGRFGQIPLAYSTNSFTDAVNRTYAEPIYSALVASSPFSAVENGFVGSQTDGLTELDNGQRLTSTGTDANNGNVVQTVELSFAGHGPGGPGGPPPASLGAYTVGGPGGLGGPGAPGGPASMLSGGYRQVNPAGIAAAVGRASGATVTAADVASATVALGFGADEDAALQAAESSAATPFAATFGQYQQQWLAYDAGLHRPPASVAGDSGSVSASTLAQAYWLSANVIKASEDKTFIGDTAASLASPWGQAVPAGNGNGSDHLATYFGSYREVFPRDAYETFTGFLADGDLRTAREMVRFWFNNLQLPNGAFPRNGLVNGKAAPDTGGLQLDETADPILAAWQAGLASDRSLYLNHIRPAADFLVANGPETTGSVERWEEQTGYSPSTIADEVAGLVAASKIASVQGDSASARVFAATADNFRNLVMATTITSGGYSVTGHPLAGPYFIRVSKNGNPNSSYDYTLGNGNPQSYDQRSVIDQGFLELVRQGELGASAPAVQNTLAIAAQPSNGAGIDVTIPSVGTGVLRYTGDGYGDCYPASNDVNGLAPDLSPANQDCPGTGVPWAFQDTGTGHPWPVLSGENGEYQIAAGNIPAAVADLNFMLKTASGVGLVPEQVWDDPSVPAGAYPVDTGASVVANGAGTDPASLADPQSASIGFVTGQADGSAAPLTWAQAQELRLIVDLGSGSLIDQPSIVAQRYAGAGDASTSKTPLTVTAPLAVGGGNVPANMVRPSAAVDGTSTTVTGTTTPGATVDVAVTPDPDGSSTTTASSVGPTVITTVTADPVSGAFSVPVTLAPGANSVAVATTAGDSPAGTNEALFTLVDVLPPGTVVLDAPAGVGGGSGPGTYAYPTSTPFPPDTFKLDGMLVVNGPNATTTVQVQIANMQSIYGSLLGGQLLDLYIHAAAGGRPARDLHSPAPATAGNYSGAPLDNYTIAPDAAWNQLVQVDGFGNDNWVTPASTSGGIAGATSLGTPQVSFTQLAQGANGETPGLVDITLPDSVLGTPGPGWTFTLTLAGQNGFASTDLRGFTATPGQYTFGVCSTQTAAQASPPAICGENPNDVPDVMDTIPPLATDSVPAELSPGPGGSDPALAGPTIGVG
jgi:glucoamylase